MSAERLGEYTDPGPFLDRDPTPDDLDDLGPIPDQAIRDAVVFFARSTNLKDPNWTPSDDLDGDDMIQALATDNQFALAGLLGYGDCPFLNIRDTNYDGRRIFYVRNTNPTAGAGFFSDRHGLRYHPGNGAPSYGPWPHQADEAETA